MTADEPIELDIAIEASPETVYRFLTEAELLLRWMGISAEIEARPGGLFRVVPGPDQAIEGRYLELEPNRRVVFSWGWIGSPEIPPGSTRVEIDLQPTATGCRVVLVHRGLSETVRPEHVAGWSHYARRLALAAAGTDTGFDALAGQRHLDR